MHTVNLRPSTRNRLLSRPHEASASERALPIVPPVSGRSDHRWVLAGAAAVVLGSLFGVSAGFRARLHADRGRPTLQPAVAVLATPVGADTAVPAPSPLPGSSTGSSTPTATLLVPRPSSDPRMFESSPSAPVFSQQELRDTRLPEVPPNSLSSTAPVHAPQAPPDDTTVPPTELLVRGYSLTGQAAPVPRQ